MAKSTTKKTTTPKAPPIRGTGSKAVVRAKAAPRAKFQFASAGRYTIANDDGTVNNNAKALTQISAARAARSRSKVAGMFSEGGLGGANIADSENIGYYSYQFPVDQMEMPASRAEEIEFFRLAYTRDPIVSRAIDLHTELPLSKMRIEKPKSSVDAFSDYVFDYYQRLMNDTRLFSVMIAATREYQLFGESFLFIEQPDNYLQLEVCPAAAKALKRGRGFQAGTSPLTEATHAPIVGQETSILPDFITQRAKKASAEFKVKSHDLQMKLADEGIEWNPKEDPDDVLRVIVRRRAALSKLKKQDLISNRVATLAASKLAAMAKEEHALIEKAADTLVAEVLAKQAAARMVTAAPGDESTDAAPPADAGTAPPPAGEPGGEVGAAPGSELPEPGADGDAPLDTDGADGDFGGGMGGFSGGGGGGGGSIPANLSEAADTAVNTVNDAKRHREMADLQRYIHLLERKKSLLEEFQELAEKKALEKEIFSHVVNEDFEGFDGIQTLQTERIEISNEESDEPTITYKPSEGEKASYLNDPAVSKETKASISENGTVPLNTNPFLGSYVIHFARKKSGYELHGKSALAASMRPIIYREKLRQVQTTLASRNMTPKTLITAPGVSEIQIAQLRAHADELKNDPDYTIVTNYEVTWNEIDAQSRLLNLADEWQHTNSNLAIGLGFSPEILIGESLFSGGRLQLDLMAVTYTQFREELSDIIENKIFKPIALLKGFYEMDNYGRPRWIYPKVTFGALALRDSNDLYEMLFNLYSKGSLPVSAIYDLLGLDTETVTRDLEKDLFTVSDSKFNEALSSMYGSIGGDLIAKTDIINRMAKSMNLTEQAPGSDGLEGSGEGV